MIHKKSNGVTVVNMLPDLHNEQNHKELAFNRASARKWEGDIKCEVTELQRKNTERAFRHNKENKYFSTGKDEGIIWPKI